MNRTLLVMGCAAALGMAGCGGEETPTDSTGAQMHVEFVVSPEPIEAEALLEGASSGYEWRITYTVTLTETGGLGGTIVGLGVDLSAAAGGIAVITDDDPSETTLEPADTRLEAFGTRELTFTTLYSVPGDGSEALIDFVVQIQDDLGYLFEDGTAIGIP